MAKIKPDAIEHAELLLRGVIKSNSPLHQVREAHVAWALVRRAGVLQFFRTDCGAKKAHIETAMRRLFPNVPWLSS